jgi:hypothetical protein
MNLFNRLLQNTTTFYVTTKTKLLQSDKLYLKFFCWKKQFSLPFTNSLKSIFYSLICLATIMTHAIRFYRQSHRLSISNYFLLFLSVRILVTV